MMIVSSFISQKTILHLWKHDCLGNDVTLNELKPTYAVSLKW